MTALDQWTEYMKAAGASAATVKTRVVPIRAIQREAGVEDPLLIRRQHVLRYFARPLSPWSRLTYWKSVRAWCAFLIDFGMDAETDLLRGISKPRRPAPVARPLTDEVVQRLLAAQLSPRAWSYVRLALFEGLRVHEIAKIRGEHFDWAAGWLMVTGKGGDTAPIPIHPEVRKLGDTMPEFGYWFPSPRDRKKHVNPEAISQTITAALQSVGCTATAHQLRDTAATRMQRVVKDIRLTQTMLRHQSPVSTAKYAGVSDDDMQRAVLSLDWQVAVEPEEDLDDDGVVVPLYAARSAYRAPRATIEK